MCVYECVRRKNIPLYIKRDIRMLSYLIYEHVEWNASGHILATFHVN